MENELQDQDLNLEGADPINMDELDIFLQEDDEEKVTLAKQLKTALAQKEHWRTKATAIKEPIKTNASTPEAEDRLRKLELRTEGYSADEVEFILKTGSAEDPYVQAAIKAMRDKKRIEDATPGPSNGSAVYKKYSEEDLKNMSTEDLAKILPKE